MFNEWLICVFSYNRGIFLQNMLDSIRQFYPDMKLAIFDDGSDDMQTMQVLSAQKHSGVYVYSSSEDEGDCKHGGLYSLMNVAINYAHDQNYKYAYFVQDDMQFLWRDEELAGRVEKIFERKNVLMCNFNFLGKLLKKLIEERLPLLEDKQFALYRSGVMDTGIIDLGKAHAAGLEFLKKGERDNAEYWYDKGYQMIWTSTSHLAWVPSPTTYRFRNGDKRKLCSLLPLTQKAIERVKSNKGYSFLEDYTSANVFLIKPYWYVERISRIVMLKAYIKYFLGIPINRRQQR